MEPLSIRLDTDGDCPRCNRPVLGLAEGRCSACQARLEGHWEDWPAVREALREVAADWDWPRLRAWVEPRPGQLAWALRTRTWKALEHWVHEQLWRPWARMDARRRDRGLALQVEDVAVTEARLAGIDHDRTWVRVRVLGTRVAFTYRTADGVTQEGTPGAWPFEELWTLSPTGRPASKAELRCLSCAAEVAFEDALCPYCGVPTAHARGPWVLEALQGIRPPASPFYTHPTSVDGPD